MIELTVSEPTAIELEVVEAKIKPEQTKTVIPTYEAQTVLPDAGTTLGQVNVEAIPDPTDIKEIGSNGDHDVRRYGVARVDVQPTLQHREATPNRQTQNIEAEVGFDGLSGVTVNPIPSEYIIPTGTKDISQNGTESVREYDSVNVNVPIPSGYIKPTGTRVITENGTGINVREFERVDVDVSDKPTKGVVFGDFNENGCPTSVTTYGFTFLPGWYFYDIGYNRYNRPLVMGWISHIYLNEGITDATSDSIFREMVKVTEIQMPSTLERIGGTYLFANTPLTLLDMSLLNSVPTLTTAGLGLPSGCTIRVKQSLLAEWQLATNWSALTNVVWEGV